MSHWAIPRTTPVSIKPGDRGIAVWALQRALNVVNTDVVADGIFGDGTRASVKTAQLKANLTADGIAGPITQRYLVARCCGAADDALPGGLLDGFAQGEGGYYLAPVNWDTSDPEDHPNPGIDCGTFQRRVYQADYENDQVIQTAFDCLVQARTLAASLTKLRGVYIGRTGTNDGYGGMRAAEKAWRLAALDHNFPAAAERLSTTPVHQLAASWTAPASWVTVFGYRFPDGTPVRTPLDWCHLYSGVLAGAHGHKGNVTKLCSTWP